MKRRMLMSLALTAFLLGALLTPAQAARLLFRNDSNAYVYVTLTWSIFKELRGFCVMPHGSVTEPLEEEPAHILAQFYVDSKNGNAHTCKGPVQYEASYANAWRNGIEFWAVGSDENSYRFYHN